MLGCLPCCNTQNWTYEVYLKRAPEDYEGPTIEVFEDKIFSTKEWAKKSNAADPSRIGERIIPAGVYVADEDNKKKFHVVEEINPKNDDYLHSVKGKDSGFWADSPGGVRFKAALVTALAVIPLYTIATVFINIIRIPLNILGVIKNTFYKTIEAFDKHNFNEAIHTFAKRMIVDLTNVLVGGICSVIRAPFYAIALQVAAIYAIFCPYEGRQIVADVERSWHYPCIEKDDIAFKENTQIDSFDSLLYVLNNKVHFLFFCFQPHGTYAKEKYDKKEYGDDALLEGDMSKYVALELA